MHDEKTARRERFLAMTDAIGQALDTRGVTDEQIERDLAAWRKDRRRGETPREQPAETPAVR